jgi:four helix bundle protein
MNVKRFEDLEIWQEARKISKIVFEISSVGLFSNDFRFRDQIRASSGSAMDNIAEGFERGGNKEFYQFLSISKGSTGEVRSQSYRAFNYKYINQEKLDEILELTDSISRKTFNLMQHIKKSDINGLKYQ